jgi:hypothetical protein
MAATALVAAGNVIFDPYFDREIENTLVIIAGGVGIGTAASFLKIPSPFIAVRLAKELATNAKKRLEAHREKND